MDSDGEPLKDHRAADSGPRGDLDLNNHANDQFQQQNMFVGMHFPQRKHKRKHHHHHKRPGDATQDGEKLSRYRSHYDNYQPPAYNDNKNKPTLGPAALSTPPAQRVQFILGQEDDPDGVDHTSHEIFCEMETLKRGGMSMEWKETARWIKFEEDVEEAGERWSKPHVATLSLHSLFELRKGISSGTIMLDVDANNLIQITDLVLDNMIASKQMDAEHRDIVQDALLSRHRHQFEGKDKDKKSLPMIRSLADIGKKASDKKLGRLISRQHSGQDEGSTGSNFLDVKAQRGSTGDLMRRNSSADSVHGSISAGQLSPNKSGHTIDREGSQATDITEHPSTQKFNEHFLKKIPPGAEASNILVGELDVLQHPLIAFMRLEKASILGDLTEVPVPSRFIFVLLGPTGNQMRYHEIGRSIATLMSDEVFHDVAYKARNRGDLLAGIDEFLDQVTVLPPGEWDPTIRIEPPKSIPSQEGRKKNVMEGKPGTLPDAIRMKELAEMEEPEDHTDPTLERTGRFFGGLVADIKRKAPWYWSDYKDGIHIQCLASFFFMYFACLTPIITFGGLLGTATEENMAAMESLVSGFICGITYHLFSGQPLTIIGSTGPVLVFETIVFNFSKDNGLDYLALRFWIGLWMCLILLVIVALDLSALVRYITRFTEESFAMLIALIFIVEAFKKLAHITDHAAVDLNPGVIHDFNCQCFPGKLYENLTAENLTLPILTDNVTYLNASIYGNETDAYLYDDSYAHKYHKYDHYKADCEQWHGVPVGTGCDTPPYKSDIFFLSFLLFLGTFILAMGLKMFRNTRFLPNKIRSLVSDFSVFLAICLMVMTDALIGLDTPKLNVPAKFRPTRDDRGWVIDPFKNPIWSIPAAIPPALLAVILIFMDQQITAVIVNRKENKLKKGSGYHLDLFLISVQIGVCSVLGTPWFVAATVLSINHVRSLTRESESSAPGEKPKFLGVREQRLTGVLVFTFVGLSALMASVLKYIPMPVLYGVFLFMGISSLKGIQMMQRVMILFMPAKYQPDYIYLRKVPTRRAHLFTLIQIICLAVLWTIKSIKMISIVFPLMVLAMCFVRKALDWVFTRHELMWLDDIIPEAHKRDKEDNKGPGTNIEMAGGMINIPLKDGKSINIPVDKITYNPDVKKIQISEDMAKTAIWKQLAANESDPELHDRLRKPRLSTEIDPDDIPITFKAGSDKTNLEHENPAITVTEETSPRQRNKITKL